MDEMEKLREFGWLPGGHTNEPCLNCKKPVNGAKNCWRCEDCANAARMKDLDARIAAIMEAYS